MTSNASTNVNRKVLKDVTKATVIAAAAVTLIATPIAVAHATTEHTNTTHATHATNSPDGSYHACHKKSDIVEVYLPGKLTDGNPAAVACSGISHVHHCVGHSYERTCLARLEGFDRYVLVTGVDFPRAAFPKK